MPLMGSRGGGSVRGFGRFGKNLLLSVIDSFGRSTSGSLGTSSDGKAVWRNVIGTFTANGSAATTSDSTALSVVDLDGSNITNLQADMGGGTGVSFWVQDSNNYYALYPTFSTTTNTSTNCVGPGGSGGYGSWPGNVCGINGTSGCGAWYNYCAANRQVTFTGQTNSCGGYPGSWPGTLDNVCGPGWYMMECRCSSYTWSGTSQTTSTTTFFSTAKLLRVQGGSGTELVSTNYASNTSGYTLPSSVAISTSSNTISYGFYASANKSGTLLASGTSSPSSPVKGLGAGVYRTSGGGNQSNTVDNFSVTVTP